MTDDEKTIYLIMRGWKLSISLDRDSERWFINKKFGFTNCNGAVNEIYVSLEEAFELEEYGR
jgi:hypothetical protein